MNLKEKPLFVRLSKTDKLAEIEKGIAAYKHEQAVLLRAISRSGNRLTASRFDRIFGDFAIVTLPDGTTIEKRNRCRLRFLTADGNAFILGNMTQGQWAMWLDLLQLLVVTGKAKITTQKGEIVYGCKPARKAGRD